MAKTFTVPVTQSIQASYKTLVNADSFIAANGGTSPTNTKLLCTAGADGSILKSLTISSDDSSTRVVQFWISSDSGVTKHLLGSISVAANSGTNGSAPNVDPLGSTMFLGLCTDSSGKYVISLPASHQIYYGVTTAAVTSGRTLYLIATLEDF
jgi:hypothetical protein